jgi:ParB family transcriptional regulator, chromosome partitioning protein
VSAASGDILIDEVSLAENIERAPLHPLDQYRAFQTMRDKGMTEEAIAAAFFVGVNVVKQRLRLASVSPAPLEIYAEDGMTLEQLMAFTVSQDHARQEQVWEAIRNSWHIASVTLDQAGQASIFSAPGFYRSRARRRQSPQLWLRLGLLGPHH